MSGLKLGDLILDPRRMVYIQSLKALVCTGMQEALHVGIAGGLRGVLERVDAMLIEYKPEALIVLGSLTKDSAITGISRRWGKSCRVQFAAHDPNSDARDLAESLGCEVHHELVWGNYRFIEKEESIASPEVQLTTIVGDPHYSIKIGRNPFGGMKLAVFLKGPGRLVLPSVSPVNGTAKSIFEEDLGRYDVFAVGHQRVLPLGKVVDLKPYKGLARGLSLSKASSMARRKNHKESQQ
jgi:hypothetical protein